MKKFCYVTLFALLGVIVSFLLHGLLELGIVALLEHNFARFSLGLSWEEWFLVHRYGSMFLFIFGITLGLQQGYYWWPIIYPDDANSAES